jgi:cyclophilin family peptidyl-prolyl cis-trans isomerase
MRFLPYIFIFLLSACQQSAPEKEADSDNLFHVIRAGDTRAVTEIINFIKIGSPAERKEALRIAASIQSSALLAEIEKEALSGKHDAYIEDFAFAIGQIGNENSMETLNVLAERSEINDREALIAAMGKLASADNRDMIYNDSSNGAGVAEALYRLAARAELESAGVERALKLLAEESAEVRFFAAQALYRQRAIDLSPHLEVIRGYIKGEDDEEVRAALIGSLKNAVGEIKTKIITAELAERPNDFYTVKAIKALGKEDVGWASGYVIPILGSSHYQSAITASTFLKANFQSSFMPAYSKILSQIPEEEVRCVMLGSLAQMGDERAQEELRDSVYSSGDIHQRIFALQQLKITDVTLELMREIVQDPQAGILRGHALARLVEADSLKKMVPLFETALASDDITLICHAANYFHDQHFKNSEEPILSLIEDALSALQLPRQSEGQVELSRTLAFLTDKEFVPPIPAFNHPVDSAHCMGLGVNPQIEIETNKGMIHISLNTNKAPTSVSAIVKLVESGFYNGKSFHRVVPDFVAQGGCPRGDGWGSPDFTIRSEFSDLSYEAGTVGLASAGRDTESCQFFITHSPTPHLDGRYTIIGKVVKGMDVVHNLTVGDKMIRVEVKN